MRGKASLKWINIDLSSKLPLTYGVNVNYYKPVHHPIPTLPLWTGNTLAKQISKLSFQLSSQIYSLLAQTEGERKNLFGGCKKGDHIVRLSQEHLVVIRDQKVSPFVKLEVILPLFCFLLDPLTNMHYSTWSSVMNLWIDFRTCQK